MLPALPSSLVPDALADMRVVLPADGVRARVFDGAAWHDGFPLVSLRLAEDEEAYMASHADEAVLLKERWPTAFVNVDGAWHAGVPVFRERRQPDGSLREVRVTVDALRERRS